ncbi:MAG: excinuclease ABC subunit UvrC [Alphaproteobacteria bacterium]
MADTTTDSTADSEPQAATRLETGAAVIAAYLPKLGNEAGVYRMIATGGEALYVGKAHNLRKRVTTYSRPDRLPIRLQRMVAETVSMEFVTCASEVEALLLENNLIKQLMPRYNVLLRDDKTFPDILIRHDHDFPQIEKHRGARTIKGDYFGPFASAGAVNRTLNVLQRAFLLRNCSDGVFRNRSRPCLQYQIKRCSAPCVGLISKDDYAATVDQAKAFLAGRSQEVKDALATAMQDASQALDFEQAASLRDRLRAMAHVQSSQDINVEGLGDADVIALEQRGGQTCIQVFFYRAGRNNGNRAYFPSHDKQMEPDRVLSGFLGQFYETRPPPKLILVNIDPAERALLEEALSIKAERRVSLSRPQRGGRRKAVEMAADNAREAMERRLAETSSQHRLLSGLADLAGLDVPPARVEVYDNSHIQGRQAVGAMIVAGPDGFSKNSYRKFNIRGETGSDTTHSDTQDKGTSAGGDDYAMTQEVIHRRFARALKEDPDRQTGVWPDLVILDGGKGQLSAAQAALDELGLGDDVPLMAVAKGPEREAGRERILLPGRADPILLPPRDPVLYFIQRLRDEAHRFAIGSHRKRRAKDQARNPLDEIPGIGARRKKALLLYFGSAKAVSRAAVADLEKVDGISKTVARQIHGFFHPNG